MHKINTTTRLRKTYLTLGKTFGKWVSPIFTGIFLSGLKLKIILYNLLDKLFLPQIANQRLENPILIKSIRRTIARILTEISKRDNK